MATPESQGGIDYPDGGFASGTELYGLVGDLAELAVRLETPPSVDRSGNILLQYDFRYGPSICSLDTAGLGETTEIQGTGSLYGGYCLVLYRVADADSYSGFAIGVPARSLGNVGVEVLFNIQTALPNLKLYISRYTGSQWIRAGLRWDTTDGKVYVGSDAAGWEESGDTIPTQANLAVLHSMKLVINESDVEYVRAYVSGQEIALPTKEPESQADTTEPKTYLYFYNALGPTTASNVYVDAFMITCNEPSQ